MISVTDILQSMYAAVNGICDRTFVIDRPAAVNSKINSFIVCWLPSGLSNDEIGQQYEYRMASTRAQFDIYVRDKSGAGNSRQSDIKTMGAKVDAVFAKFPISDTVIKAIRPEIFLQASDDNGFHVTCVRCDLQTK